MVNSVANVIYLSNSQDCVVNAMICGVNDGGNMTYLKDCRELRDSDQLYQPRHQRHRGGRRQRARHVQQSITTGSTALLARFQNNASDCLFYNNPIADINQAGGNGGRRAENRHFSCVSRESGIPARNACCKEARRGASCPSSS